MKLTKVLSLAFLVGFILPLSGLAGEKNQGPAAVFLKKIHDFGRLSDKAAVTHHFRIQNKGSQPLRLYQATSS